MKWKDKHTAATSVSHHVRHFIKLSIQYINGSQKHLAVAYIDSCHKTSWEHDLMTVIITGKYDGLLQAEQYLQVSPS